MSSTVSARTTTLLPGIPAQPTSPDSPSSQLQPRLVPAVIGTTDRAQTIYIPCPGWCTTDHLDRTTHLDDVMHYSDGATAQVLTLTDVATGHSELTTTVALDPTAADPRLRAAHLVVTTGASTDAYLTPSMAEQLADDLDAFAKQLRRQAATARAHNAAAEVQS